MGSRYIEDIFNTVTAVVSPGPPVLTPTQIWMVRGLLLVYLIERRGVSRDTALMIVGVYVVTQMRAFQRMRRWITPTALGPGY